MDNQGVIVQSVAFASGAVEVVFQEIRDAEKIVQKYTTLVIPADSVGELYDEMTESIQQVVDRALELLRAPADRITARR